MKRVTFLFIHEETVLTRYVGASSSQYVSKIISLLDTIINAFTSSFHNFCTAGGLDTLLARIKSEVNTGLEQADESMDESEAAASGTLAPYDRCSAIKSMLKFLLRMMESSGTADGLRNLIESSIPHSLLKIVAKPKVFGPSVFTLSKFTPRRVFSSCHGWRLILTRVHRCQCDDYLYPQ